MHTDQTNEIFRLRAHHGMCLAYFEGKGYSDTFTAHMGQIRAQLEADPEQIVEWVTQTDVICGACPNNVDGVCSSAEKVERYDRVVMRALRQALQQDEKEAAQGDIYPPENTGNNACTKPLKMTYAAFSKRVREHILIAGKRSEICGDCQWNEICREKDRKLKRAMTLC